MRILIDTNIILDVLSKRAEFYVDVIPRIFSMNC